MKYFKFFWLPYALNFKDNSNGIIVINEKKQHYNSITQRIMYKHILRYLSVVLLFK